MDQRMLEQIEAISKDHPEVELMLHEHRSLDDKVTELTAKAYLTPEEDVELHRLKKEKLMLKDRIELLIHQQKSA